MLCFCMMAIPNPAARSRLYINLEMVWAEPDFSGLVLLFRLNWFGI